MSASTDSPTPPGSNPESQVPRVPTPPSAPDLRKAIPRSLVSHRKALFASALNGAPTIPPRQTNETDNSLVRNRITALSAVAGVPVGVFARNPSRRSLTRPNSRADTPGVSASQSTDGLSSYRRLSGDQPGTLSVPNISPVKTPESKEAAAPADGSALATYRIKLANASSRSAFFGQNETDPLNSSFTRGSPRTSSLQHSRGVSSVLTASSRFRSDEPRLCNAMSSSSESVPASSCGGGCGPVSPCSLMSPCGVQPTASTEDLKSRLTPLQYQITQQKGTERPYSGKYYKLKDPGIYECVVCSEPLFSSTTKYSSNSGWPAFYDVMDKSKVKFKQDLSHVGSNLLLLAMKPDLVRTEVLCARCDAHLGHMFDDGPKPTGKRFCINSAALNFIPAHSSEDGESDSGKHKVANSSIADTRIKGVNVKQPVSSLGTKGVLCFNEKRTDNSCKENDYCNNSPVISNGTVKQEKLNSIPSAESLQIKLQNGCCVSTGLCRKK